MEPTTACELGICRHNHDPLRVEDGYEVPYIKFFKTYPEGAGEAEVNALGFVISRICD